MESRIRTDGYLDLELCQAVAEKVAPFMTDDESARTQIVG
jgi:hypothetical protein